MTSSWTTRSTLGAGRPCADRHLLGRPLLARELETGTYRLAWTQSVTRSRWLATKLAVVGLATVTLAGLLTLTITWWYRALDTVSANQYAVLDRRDIAPIGYAAFAFASGALIGAVIRRTLPAMATTLAVYVFARIATTFWVRPHLLTPIHKTLSFLNAGPSAPVQVGVASVNGSAVHLVAQGSGPAHSWTLSSQVVSSSGHKVSSTQLAAFVHQYCPNVGLPPAGPPPGPGITRGGDPAGQACLNQAAKMFRLLVTYQPANRYWTFQWLETGIFVSLAASICCYWWVTRRTSSHGQGPLQLAVRSGGLRVRAKQVAKRKVASQHSTVSGTNVEMVRIGVRWCGEGFPARYPQVAFVVVAERLQPPDDRRQVVAAGDHDIQINDRLGRKPRGCGAADMLDADR